MSTLFDKMAQTVADGGESFLHGAIKGAADHYRGLRDERDRYKAALEHIARASLDDAVMRIAREALDGHA